MGEKRRLQDALDDGLRNIEAGHSLQEALPRGESGADELEPLLEVARQLRDAPRPAARPAAFSAGMERMLAAAAEDRQPARAAARPRGGLLAWWQQAVALRFVLTSVTALVVLALGALLLPSWLGAPVGRTATLSRVDGVVEILPAAGATWRPAVAGDEVGSGDRLRTSALSAATLIFFDGSVTDLAAETEITLAQVSSRRRGGGMVIVIHQWIGQTHTRVRPLPDAASRFAIETLTAVAAVRGTEFVISVEMDGSTWVRVAEGLVDVVAEGVAAQVRAGEELAVHPEEPRLCVTAAPTVTLEPTPTPSPEPPSEEPAGSEPTALPTPTPIPLPTDTPSPSLVPTSPPTPLSTATPIPPTPTWEGPPSPSP